MEITISACQTAWGWVGTAVSPEGLLATGLPVTSPEEALAPLRRRWPGAQEGTNARLAALHEKLQRYFLGEDVDLSTESLDLRRATDFQARVWELVRSIPRGQVRSYRWVARQAGSPQGARAVGRAMATNPFPIVVPCHRVVGQDGHLTGFGGGLDMKSRLLAMEGARVVLLDDYRIT